MDLPNLPNLPNLPDQLSDKIKSIYEEHERTYRPSTSPSISPTSSPTSSSSPSSPSSPPLADEEFPDWNEVELFNFFTQIGIFFLPAEGSNPSVMKECFTILVHRKGVLFHRLMSDCGTRIIEPERIVAGSRHLPDDEVGICLTHDSYGQPLKYLEPFSICKVDWLKRHALDENLRTQVLDVDQ